MGSVEKIVIPHLSQLQRNALAAAMLNHAEHHRILDAVARGSYASKVKYIVR